MTKIYSHLEAKVMSLLLGIGVVWSIIAIFVGTPNSTELFFNVLCLYVNLGCLLIVNFLAE